MTRYVLRRLLIALPALLLISVVVYAILALAPGDPIGQLAGGSDIPPEVRANLRQQFGLDDPVYVRYLKWLTNIVLGDWGYSFASRSPALGLISQRLPTTLEVVGTAYLVAVVIALPLGVSSATRPYTWYDHFATALSFAGFSVPTLFTAMLAEATLSFLGLGFPPDVPTWGRLLYDAQPFLTIAPSLALFPGLVIFLAVLSINFVGDGLRDAMDPRRTL